jgi:hypothetical protein
VPCCHPYGVQAMWSERSRHRRLGTAPGSLGKVAVLAVRFLRDVADAQPVARRLAGHTLPRHPIDPLPWGVIGYQRQIDQTRLKIDAQPASHTDWHHMQHPVDWRPVYAAALLASNTPCR